MTGILTVNHERTKHFVPFIRRTACSVRGSRPSLARPLLRCEHQALSLYSGPHFIRSKPRHDQHTQDIFSRFNGAHLCQELGRYGLDQHLSPTSAEVRVTAVSVAGVAASPTRRSICPHSSSSAWKALGGGDSPECEVDCQCRPWPDCPSLVDLKGETTGGPTLASTLRRGCHDFGTEISMFRAKMSEAGSSSVGRTF